MHVVFARGQLHRRYTYTGAAGGQARERVKNTAEHCTQQTNDRCGDNSSFRKDYLKLKKVARCGAGGAGVQ